MKITLRLKLTITVLFLIAIPLLISAHFAIQVSNREFIEHAEEHLLTTNNALHEYMDELHGELAIIGQAASSNPSIIEAMESGDTSQLSAEMDRLFTLIQKNHNLTIYEIGNAEGTVLYRAHNPEVRGDSKGDQPLYEEALMNRVAFGVEMGKSGLAMRTVIPIMASNELIGTVTSGYQFDNDIADRFMGLTGVDVILYLKDKPVASSMNSEDPGERLYPSMSALIPQGKELAEEVSISGTQYISYASSIVSSYGTVEGSIVTVLDMMEYYEVQDEMVVTQLSIVAISLIASVLISYLFIRNIADPIEQIVDKMHMVEQGIYNVRAVVRRNDELSDLASGFNNMAKVIMDSIGQLEMRNDQLEERVIIDGLTNCYNKEYITHLLDECIVDAKTFNRPLSVLLYDFDHFKRINDDFGHLTGDSVLVESAKITKECIREKDSLGRFGGEEFMVIMPDVDLKVARKIAERIRLNIEAATYEHQRTVTISGGLVTLSKESIKELIEKADELLYEAKELGRNRISG